jgi:hypothetical protein
MRLQALAVTIISLRKVLGDRNLPFLHKFVFLLAAEQHVKRALRALARTREEVGGFRRIYKLAGSYKHLTGFPNLLDAVGGERDI